LKTIIPKKEDVTADCLTPSEWCLTRIVKQKHEYEHICPKLTRLAELVLTIPVSNAWSEKGASKVKIIKTDLRNRLKNDMLEGLMHLTVNGPDIHVCTDQYDDLITSSIKNWLQTKSRRKLPSRNKGNKYNLLFYSFKKYHTCSYTIIKMN
jgi:hypothetical protein